MNDPNSQVHFDPWEERGNRRDRATDRPAEHGPRARLSLWEQLEALTDWKFGALLLCALLIAIAALVVVLDGLFALVGALA